MKRTPEKEAHHIGDYVRAYNLAILLGDGPTRGKAISVETAVELMRKDWSNANWVEHAVRVAYATRPRPCGCGPQNGRKDWE